MRGRRLAGLSREVLRGYGQILFCGSEASGGVLLAATLLWAKGGVCGLLGAIAAAAAGRRLPPREVLSAPGLYACNGALAGLAMAVFAGGSAWLMAPLAGALAAVVLYGISRPLEALRLPPLSTPFVIAVWALLAVLPPTVAPPWTAGGVWRIPHVLGMAVFQWNGMVGVLCAAAVLLHSRAQARVLGVALPAFVLAASAVAPPGAVMAVAALNATLTVLALRGVFLPGETKAAAIAGVACLLGTAWVAPALHVPLLVAPFNVATLAALLLVRRGETKAPVIAFAPPFCGRWQVSQGPQGSVTHQGEGGHAWDFVAVDARGRTHSGLGLRLGDYYAYGLPVCAAADGVVAAVVDGVPDNAPPRENLEARWGNLVVVEHAPGVYGLTCHLQPGSIRVQLGQRVIRGEVLMPSFSKASTTLNVMAIASEITRGRILARQVRRPA